MPFYGCLRYHKRGVNICRNGLQIRQDVLDQAVLDVLTSALDVDVLADAVQTAVATLRAGETERAAQRVTLTAELAQIAARERRLLDALVDGDASAATIRGRLRDELTRRDRLVAELEQIDTAAPANTEQLVRDVTARAADLRGMLTRHVAQARQVVRMLLEGRLVCEPFDDGEARGYAFSATGTYQRLGVRALESVNVGGGPNGIRTRV